MNLKQSKMNMEQFNINTTEGARAYLESEGLNPDELVKEGLAFIKSVKERIKLQKLWIKVSEQNPKDYQEVLVSLENGEVFKATYCDDTMDLPNFTSEYFKLNKGVKIMYWMPYELPSIK